jgi:hypothetical protein
MGTEQVHFWEKWVNPMRSFNLLHFWNILEKHSAKPSENSTCVLYLLAETSKRLNEPKLGFLKDYLGKSNN